MEAVGAVAVVEVEEVVAETIRNPPTSQTSLPKVSQGGNAIKVPSILIYQPEMDPDFAPCISNSGKMHISVQSQAHALGRMYSRQDLNNETGTSPLLTPV